MEILKGLRFDLTSLQAKVSDALTLAARLAPPPALQRCPSCGLGFRSANKLNEHRYLQHGGPEPSHWIEAATLAASEPDSDNDDPGRLGHRGKAADVNGLTAPGSGVEA